MKVLIVEDEPAAVRRLSRLLHEWDATITILDSLDSVSGTVQWLQNHLAPELIFMDIQLADGLSFEIFEQVEVNTPVIFCTAYDQYAIQAFKVNSIDYLLKPIDPNELGNSLEKFRKLQRSQTAQEIDFTPLIQQLSQPRKESKSRFLVKVGKKLVSVPVDKIAYFYTEFKITNLITLDGQSYAVDHPLDELEKMVDEALFFRINRQVLVSINGMENIENDYGRLNVYLNAPPQKYALVSREKSSRFKHWLDQ